MSVALREDFELISKAADASTDVYCAKRDFAYSRRVEQFRLVGELAAAVRFADEGKVAFVAIRGTSLLGNWLFTNLQAYFAPFRVVDDSLTSAQPTPYQGGFYRTPIDGSLHQGFCRAFSWLWYGTEPILGESQRTREVGLGRLTRYVALFFLLPFLLWLSKASIIASLATALIIAFVFVTFEAGVWEDVFRVAPQLYGEAPFTLLRRLNQCDKVVFTGHSLGGAVALIAFAIYREWCQSDGVRRDNAVLVTFGAPRVGNVAFMRQFCVKHSDLFVHVIHPGDPVPELPPYGLSELRSRKLWRRGLVGYIVVLLLPLWVTIGKLYQPNRAARWKDDVLIEISGVSNKLLFSSHKMNNIYQEWAREQKRSKQAAAQHCDAGDRQQPASPPVAGA